MRSSRAALLLLFLALVPRHSDATGQDAPPAKAAAADLVLNVKGEVERPLKLTPVEFRKLPRKTVHAKDHDGKEADFEGVAVVDVLEAAGVKFGKDLRGPALATYLVVEAADGYRAVFALPELDPAFTDRVVLLADQRDKKPLDERHGPLQIIVPGEKRQARWVRQVIALKVGRA
jgi:DMSO/TMAO reductase YedYZ molybdopterin-dependent catalytic subunit